MFDHFVEQRRLFQVEHVAGFRKNDRPAAGRCCFRNRLGSTQLSSSSPHRISAGVGTFRIAPPWCRSTGARPGSAWCWPSLLRHGAPVRRRNRRGRADPSAGTECGSAPRASVLRLRPSDRLILFGVSPALRAEASRFSRPDPEPTAASVIDSARSGALRPICSDE